MLKIRKNIALWKKQLKDYYKKNRGLSKLLIFVFLLGLFFRIYRTSDLLRFYYDQGRDAKVVWNLLHNGKLFLVGPVTGLAGIFLGPLYYYLITPFYLFSGGNPVLPAVFLAFSATLANLVIYFIGLRMKDRTTGVIAFLISSVSYYLILAARWLSNPTLILLTSAMLLWTMWEIVFSKSEKHWLYIALLVGVSLQFEAASAVFYLPMILVFAFWQRDKLPKRKTLIWATAVFGITLVPQVAFNFRHDNILFENFRKVIIEEQSFKLSFWQVLSERLDFFWDVFYSKVLPDRRGLMAIIAGLSALGLLKLKNDKKSKNAIALLLIFIGVPLLGYILFQGNFGRVYDYYLTGYYLPMILLFSLGLRGLWTKKVGKLLVVLVLGLIVQRNILLDYYFLRAGVDGPEHITLGNELQAVDWVINDVQQRGEFNVDVYVPPVIPHAYDYLFDWRTSKKCDDNLCGFTKDKQVSLLYTLYEVDPPHPWRLEAWLERQSGIGEVLEEDSFGGITVQRRQRLEK